MTGAYGQWLILRIRRSGFELHANCFLEQGYGCMLHGVTWRRKRVFLQRKLHVMKVLNAFLLIAYAQLPICRLQHKHEIPALTTRVPFDNALSCSHVAEGTCNENALLGFQGG